ncbi:hypothetical protein [Rhizobium sp. BK602]|uniref:hypothetical protein n=1 Tax=Rhizobium sp. BK602 TaxID=2586986 RepID=UPI001621F8E0|nr:hypothetical protein [Rhizobium sp. BK602]MBB3612972.1 hypothetical protein [Rhizobium sp. BK602]
MLSPIGAVSVVGVPTEKPVVATAETASVQTAATPVAVLSSTVNASVEGKLNMLLVAARERMFESLLAAIEAASVALDLPRDPDESNAAFAQRLADAIRSLPPQQLAAVQQRLNVQANVPLPLPLIAEALDNPDAPEAVRLAMSLETASAPEPDAIIKAVVNSYGQNAADAEPAGSQAPQRAVAAGNANAGVTSPSAPAETPVVSSAPPLAAAPAAPVAQAARETLAAVVAALEAVPLPMASADPEAALDTEFAPPQALPDQRIAIPLQVIGAFADNTAAAAGEIAPPQPAVPGKDNAPPATPPPPTVSAEGKLPTEIALIRSPIDPPPLPRQIQQIRADIKEGLQVAVATAVDAAASGLVQVRPNDMLPAERIIAQALAVDREDLQPSPQAGPDEKVRNAAVLAGGMPSVSEAAPDAPSAAASALIGKQPVNAPAPQAMDMPDTPMQAGAAIASLLGVPFAVAHYLPADVPGEDDPKRVDRVDPADEERRDGQGGETAQDRGEDDRQADEQEHPAAENTDPVPDGMEAEAEAAPTALAAPRLPALPAASPAEPPPGHVFDFFQRMVGWE